MGEKRPLLLFRLTLIVIILVTSTGSLEESLTLAIIASTSIFLQGVNLTLPYISYVILLCRSSKTALLWEGDEPGQNRAISYAEMLRKVCKIANSLLSRGVRKGDVVTIYMPMIPE